MRNRTQAIWAKPLVMVKSIGLAGLLCLSAQAFGAEATTGERPEGKPGDVRLPRLPSGPAGPGRFGAYYTRLRYTDAWERPWRVGDAADVLVRFDDGGHRFIFWRGTSYIPCWVSENGIWYTNEFCETSGGGTEGCAEPISDKQTRYAHVRILESHDARVVVHWRYALTDVHYRLAHTDPQTGWHDWVDEYYTIYPDAVAVRKIVLWTSRMDVWHEFQEAIVLNPPGTAPEDNLETAALSIANLDGKAADYVWDTPGKPRLTASVPNACIEVVNLKAPRRPFLIIDPAEACITTFNGHAPKSRFNWWDHWPVSQDKTWTRVATSNHRPSHTSLSWIARPREPVPKDWKAYARTEQSVTKLLLCGLTRQTAKELTADARSWLMAPPMRITSSGFTGGSYDRADRAYHVERKEAAPPAALEFTLQAGKDRPVVNPAVVVRGWGDADARIEIGNAPTPEPGSRRCRIAHARRLDRTDLVVWVKLRSQTPVSVRLRPAGS